MKHFKKHQQIIHKVAWKYRNLQHLDQLWTFEERVAEGFEVLALAYSKKEEGRSLDALLWKNLENRFRDIHRKCTSPKGYARFDRSEGASELLYSENHQGRTFICPKIIPSEGKYEEHLHELSKEAKEVAKIILEAPKEFLTLCGSENMNREILGVFLRDFRGWKTSKTRKFFKEL